MSQYLAVIAQAGLAVFALVVLGAYFRGYFVPRWIYEPVRQENAELRRLLLQRVLSDSAAVGNPNSDADAHGEPPVSP